MMIENICCQISIKAKKYEISIEKQLEDTFMYMQIVMT